MGKIAFVFAGQGAQYTGMGKDLYDAYPTAQAIMDSAEAIRPGTLHSCFEGSKEELSITINTQPCLMLVDYVCAVLARETGAAEPACCAGFSLGEVAAAAFCGMLSFEDAFRLVVKRAELMQACAERNPGAMFAALKLTGAQTEEICAGIDRAYPVNYNCPGQTVVACAVESADTLVSAVKAAGGRAMKLNVSGAFHSPFMSDAAAGLRAELEGYSLAEPNMPLYANRSAQPYVLTAAKDTLAQQISSPVRWSKTVENMIAAGVDTFVEVGAGTTLCGLIKKTSAEVKLLNVADIASLDKLKASL